MGPGQCRRRPCDLIDSKRTKTSIVIGLLTGHIPLSRHAFLQKLPIGKKRWNLKALFLQMPRTLEEKIEVFIGGNLWRTEQDNLLLDAATPKLIHLFDYRLSFV